MGNQEICMTCFIVMHPLLWWFGVKLTPPLRYAHILDYLLHLLLLPLLSRFSRVRLCATPQMTAHQAAPPLGFSRQEYWRGLPFLSPMHVCMLSCFSGVQLCATPQMTAHQAPPSLGFSRQEHWSELTQCKCDIKATRVWQIQFCFMKLSEFLFFAKSF